MTPNTTPLYNKENNDVTVGQTNKRVYVEIVKELIEQEEKNRENN